MPAKSEQAVQKKNSNRQSKKDIGREQKIASLGGRPIKVEYGSPLDEAVRKERLNYLYDLMYPSRTYYVSSKKPRLTEGEKAQKAREKAREKYWEQKDGEKRDRTYHSSWVSFTPWYRLWASAKVRAKKKGVPFDISLDDVYALVEGTVVCPALGIPLKWDNNKMLDDSPTMDRIIPELGYVKGNIALISQRANRIKNNAYADEIGKVYTWLKRQAK